MAGPFQIKDAERHYPHERQREEPQEGDDGAFQSEPALAEHDGRVADVRAGQELAEADGLGEVRLREPAALLDHRAVSPGQHAAEGARADGEKAEEELPEIARRCYLPLRGQIASQLTRTRPSAIATAACVGSTTGTPTSCCRPLR